MKLGVVTDTVQETVGNVSAAVQDKVSDVQGRMRARRRRRMLAERWPLLALLALLVAGLVAGVAFAIAQRHGLDAGDMNAQLDDLLGAGHSSETVV